MELQNGLVRVNILVDGRIPWLNMPGPQFNMSISKALFNTLINDPRIKLEVLQFSDPKIVLKRYGFEEEKICVKEEVKIEDKKEFIETKVDEDIVTEEAPIIVDEEKFIEENNEIDDIIAANLKASSTDNSDDFIVDYTAAPVIEDEKIIYSEKQLSIMIKSQLRDILNSRVISEDFKPKYHDSLDELRSKVLKTQ